MSLDWDIRNVRDHEALFDDEQAAVTQCIVFGCIGTGIGTLTEKNWAEYHARANFLQLLDGPWLLKGGESVTITASDIRRRIGLRTNVFPEESRTAWLKRVAGRTLDEARARAEREAEHEPLTASDIRADLDKLAEQ